LEPPSDVAAVGYNDYNGHIAAVDYNDYAMYLGWCRSSLLSYYDYDQVICVFSIWNRQLMKWITDGQPSVLFVG
jgi:hypothetical protein